MPFDYAAYYEKNKERLLEYKRKYYQNNKMRLYKIERLRRKVKHDEIRAYQARWMRAWRRLPESKAKIRRYKLNAYWRQRGVDPEDWLRFKEIRRIPRGLMKEIGNVGHY